MSLRTVGPSMTLIESTSQSTKNLLLEAATLCALNGISETEAIAIFSTGFRKAQRELPAEKSDEPHIFSAAQILSEWHKNSDFLQPNGSPRKISLSDGDFSNLCRTTGTKSEPAHILDLLIHAGAVEKNGDELEALRREIIIGDSHPAAAARAIKLAASFLSTLKHNLTRNAREAPRFERTVSMPYFSVHHIPSLLGYLSVHAQAFLEDLDAWMETRSSQDDGTEIGVGIYFFNN